MSYIGSQFQKLDFFNLSRQSLAVFIAENYDAPRYAADNIFKWIYRKGIYDFSLMTDLSQTLREKISESFYFGQREYLKREISADGTRKYLIKLGEEEYVEAVMIKQPARMTLCVSSQIGCGMGCSFCRTATMGLKRNLTTSEIIRQVLVVIDDAKHFNDMFTNIVFMGMGEPLHNLRNVAEAVAILTDNFAFSIAPRKITVSTVGLVPAIKKFGETVNANIAISLNATTDEIRSKIMPVNKSFPLEKLLHTLREFPVNKRRKITIEYVMLSGVNDTEDDLKRLPKLLHGIQVKVNLIPYNDNADLGFATPEREYVHYWREVLVNAGLDVTIRWSKGRDISAACGQLAYNRLNMPVKGGMPAEA
jgi:23S rRNA (adenine2503-C2)-methyltransferase